MGKVFKVLLAIAIIVQMVVGQTQGNLLDKEWFSDNDELGSSSDIFRESGKLIFQLNLADWNGWSNVAVPTVDAWSKVTYFKITYTSDNPIVFHLYDPGYGAFQLTLPAGSNRSQIIFPNQLAQAGWAKERYGESNLNKRFRAIMSFGFGATTVGSTTGEVTEFIAYGLADDTDGGLNLANKIDGWKTTNAQTTISGTNGNIAYTLSGAGAAIDFDLSGDWSQFRGFMTDLGAASGPITLSLKNTNGKEFYCLPGSGVNAVGLGYFDWDWNADNSGIVTRGMSVLDANITGIRIAPATPGATVSGTIKSMVLKGIETEEIDVVWDNQNQFVYNGGVQVPSFETIRTKNGLPLAVTVSGAKTNVGTGYTATVALVAANPAITLKSTSKQFSIIKSPISPILRAQNATIRKGDDFWLSVIGKPETAMTSYRYSTSVDGTYSATAPSEIGTYFVKAVVAESDNYLGGETAPIEYAIVSENAHIVDVVWGAMTSFTYDGTMKAPTATVIRPDNNRVIDLIVEGEIGVGTHNATARLEVPDENFYLTNTVKQFTITKKSLSQNMISQISNALWVDGMAITPRVTVKDGDRTLAQNVDYTLSYSNNTAIGTGSATITGTGNYSGTASREFQILSSNGITFGEIEWSSQTTFTYNGSQQSPTATVKDIWGREYDVEIDGKQTNVGSHIAMVRVLDPLKHGVVLMLSNQLISYTITPKPLAVTWSNPKEFAYNKMVQVPKPSVTEDGVNLYVVNPQSKVGDYTGALAAVAEISSANKGNYQLTSNTVDYKIRKKELVVKLPNGEEFESGGTITIPDDITDKESYVKQYLTFEGFAKDTTGIADRSDNENILNITLTEIAETRSTRAAEKNYKVVISATNYDIAESEGGTVSIKDVQKSNGKHGIMLMNNIVSNKAEMKVVLPNNEKTAEAKIVIYDNIGNVVFETLARNGKADWNLTNSTGRNVANGTYLIVAEAKSTNGKVYRYSAKVGVNK
jgi:hypothetical protein